MNPYSDKTKYMQLPAKYRKAGDMPTQYEMQDAIESYLKDTYYNA